MMPKHTFGCLPFDVTGPVLSGKFRAWEETSLFRELCPLSDYEFCAAAGRT